MTKAGALFRDMNIVYNRSIVRESVSCRKTCRNPLLKRLLVLVTLLFCVEGAVWGTPFRWDLSTTTQKNNNNNGNWGTANSWVYYGSNWGATGWYLEGSNYPGNRTTRSDDVYFFGEVDSECNVNVSPAGTVGNMFVNVSASNPNNESTRTVHDGSTSLIIASGQTLKVNNLEIFGGSFTVKGPGTLEVSGTITIAEGSSFTLDGVNFSYTGSASVTIPSVTIKNTVSLYGTDLTVTSAVYESKPNITIGKTEGYSTGTVRIPGGNIGTLTQNPNSCVFIPEGDLTADSFITTSYVAVDMNNYSLTVNGDFDSYAALSNVADLTINGDFINRESCACSGDILVTGNFSNLTESYKSVSASSLKVQDSILSNTGIIDVTGGVFSVTNDITSSGQISADTVTAGGYLTQGTAAITAATSVTVTGTVNLGTESDTLAQINSPFISSGELTSYGNINGFNNLTTTGDFTNHGNLFFTDGAVISVSGVFNNTSDSLDSWNELNLTTDVFVSSGKVSLNNESSIITVNRHFEDSASGSKYPKVLLGDFHLDNMITFFGGSAEIGELNVSSTAAAGGKLVAIRDGKFGSIVYDGVTGGTFKLEGPAEITSLQVTDFAGGKFYVTGNPVIGDFAISGTSGNPLTLYGSEGGSTGSINATKTCSAAGDYIIFNSSVSPAVKGGYYYVIKNSTAASGDEYPDGWFQAGDTFIWKGGSWNHSWNNADNWIGGLLPSRNNGTETVIIQSGFDPDKLPAFGVPVSLKSLLISKGAAFDVGTNNLTLTGDLKNSGSFLGTNVTVNGDVESTGSVTVTALTVNGDMTSSGEVTAVNLNLGGDFETKGTLSVSGKILFTGSTSHTLSDSINIEGSVETEAGSVLNVPSTAAVSVSKFINSGETHVAGTVSVTSAFTDKSGNNSSYGTVVLKGPGNITVTGNNSGSLQLAHIGILKTDDTDIPGAVSFRDIIKVDSLSLNGESSENPLHLANAGTIVVPASYEEEAGSFIFFEGSAGPVLAGPGGSSLGIKGMVTESSVQNEGTVPAGWEIIVTVYTWNGSTSDQFTDAANWTKSTGGNGVPVKGSIINIPKGTNDGPYLPQNRTYDLGSASITIEENGRLYLNGSTLVVTEPLINKGEIRTNRDGGKIKGNVESSGIIGGARLVTIDGNIEFTNTNAKTSVPKVTVTGNAVFSNTGKISFSDVLTVGGDVYCNSADDASFTSLAVTGNVGFTGAGNISVTGNLAVGGDASISKPTLTVTKNLTVTGEMSVTDSGTLSIGRSEDSASSCGSLVLNTTGGVNFGPNPDAAFTVVSGNIEIENVGWWSAGGHIKAENGNIILSKDFVIGEGVIFESPVELGKNIAVTNSNKRAVTFADSLDGKDFSFTAGTAVKPVDVSFIGVVENVSALTVNGDAVFESTVNSTGTVTVNGDSTFNGSSVTTTGNQVYAGNITLSEASSLSSGTGKEITLGNTSTDSVSGPGKKLTVSGNVTLNQKAGANVDFEIPSLSTVTLGTDLRTSGGLYLSGNITGGANNVSVESDSVLSGTVSTTGNIYITNKNALPENKIIVTVTKNQTATGLYAGGNIDLVLNAAVTGIKNFHLATEEQNLSADFTVDIKGTGSLSLSEGAELTRAAGDDPAKIIGSLILNVPVSTENNFYTHSGTNLTVNKNLTSKGNFIHSALNSVPKTSVTVNAVLSAPVVNLTANANTGNEMTVSSTGKVVTNNLSVLNSYTNDGKTAANTSPLVNNGTIEINAAGTGISVPVYTGSGTVILNNGAKFENNCSAEQNKTITLTNLKLVSNASGKILAGNGNVTVSKLVTEGVSNLEVSGNSAAKTIILSSFEGNLNNLSETSGTLVLGSALSINGILETGAETTFVQGTNNVTVKGSVTNGATLNGSGTFDVTGDFTDTGTWNGTGKIIFSGTSGQTVTPKAGRTYPDVELFYAAEPVLAGNFSCKNLVVKIDATLDTNNKNLSVNESIQIEGAAAILAGTGTHSAGTDFVNAGNYTAVSGTLNVSGNVSNTGTFTAGTSVLNVAGNFSNTGTFAAGTGTVEFKGTGPHEISGTTSFYNLTCIVPETTIRFADSKTQTVTNIMTVHGEEEKNIILDSVSGTDQWLIDIVPASLDFEYVTIKNSESVKNIPEVVRLEKEKNCIDGGNNIFWFAETTVYWFGTDGNWSTKANWKANAEGTKNVIVLPSVTDTELTVIIKDSSTKELVLDTDISILKMTVEAGQKVDFAGYNVTFASTNSDFVNNGTVRLNGNQAISFAAGRKLSSGASSTVEYYDAPLNVLPLGNSYVNLKFGAGSSGTVSGNLSVSKITTVDVGAASNLTLSGTNTFTGGLVQNSGKTVSVKGSFGSGKGVELVSAEDFTLVPLSTVLISGAGNAGTFSVKEGGGKTLTVNGTVTVSDKISLSGNSAASRMIVNGSGKFVLPSEYSLASGQYLNFTNASGPVVVDSSDEECFATASSSVSTAGFPKGWIDSDNTFVWLGSENNLWNNENNWAGQNKAGAGGNTKTILIRKGIKPVLSVNLTASKIQVFDAIGFDLSDYSVTVTDFVSGTGIITVGNGTGTSGKLTVTNLTESAGSKIVINNGTFEYKGTAAKTILSEFELRNSVSLKCSGSATVTFPSVTFVANPSVSLAGNFTVSEKTGSEIKTGKLSVDSGTVSVTESVSVSGNYIGNTGAVLNLEKSLSVTGTTDNKGNVSSGTSVSFTDGVTNIGTIKAENSVAFDGTLINAGTVNSKTTASFGDAVINSGILTCGTTGDFAGKVTNSGTLNVGTGNLTFNGDYDGTGGKLTGSSGADPEIIFNGNVVFGTFIHNNDKVIFAGSGKTVKSNNQKINDCDVTGSISLNDGLSVLGDVLVTGTLSIGSNTVSVSKGVNNENVINVSNGQLSVSGNILSSGTVNISSGTILTNGNITNSGTLNNGSGIVSVKGNITNTGTWKKETGTVKIVGTGTSFISGLNDFYKLVIDSSAETAGKTVKLPAGSSNALTVSSEISIKGNEEKNLSVISDDSSPDSNDSTWWYLASGTPSVSVSNAKIGYAYSYDDISEKVISCSEILSSKNYTTFNWFDNHKFIWKGTTDSAWDTATNWQNGEGGNLTQAPYKEDYCAVIEIAEGSLTNTDNLLILDDDVTVKIFTVNAGVRCNLSSYGITAEKIINNGILALDGSKANPLNSLSITHSTSSSVEFKDWSSGTAVVTTAPGLGLGTAAASKTYNFKNLIISGISTDSFEFPSGAVLNASKMEVNGNLGKNNNLISINVSGNSVLNSPLIKTSGGQTYGGAVELERDLTFENTGSASKIIFNSVLSGKTGNPVDLTVSGNAEFNGAVDTLKVVNVTGDVLFTAPAGKTDPLSEISVSGTTTLGNATKICEIIKTTGAQNYDAVVLGNKAELSGTDITVNGTLTGSNDLKVSRNADFKNTVNSGNLTVTGNGLFEASVTSGNISVGGEGEFKSVVNGGNITVSSNGTFDGKVDCKILKVSGDAVLKDSVSSTSVEITGTSVLDGGTVNSTGVQLYNGKVTLGDNTSLSGTKITFNSEADGNTFSLSVNGEAVVNKNSYGFSDVVFNGKTTLNCDSVTNSGNQDYKGDVTFTKDILNLYGDILTFEKTVTGTGKDFSLNSSKAVVKGNVSVKNFITNAELESLNTTDVTVAATGYIQLNDTYNLNKVILSSGGKTIFTESGILGTVTLTNGDYFDLAQDKQISVTGKFIQNGNGKNYLKGSVKTTGSGSLSFLKDVYVSGNSSGDIILGGGTGSVTVSENFIVSLSDVSKNLIIASSLQAENLVVYSGKISAQKNISAAKDIVMLGSAYSADDGNVEHSGEYLYTKNRETDYSYKGFDSASLDKLPDGTVLPVSYDGELSVSSGISIKAGKNFYANGTKLSGSGNWFLDIDPNSNGKKCFCEAYNSNISYSTVRNNGTSRPEVSRGMAEACVNGGNNTNWNFEDFEILEVYTVTDNILYVKLSEPVRNLNKEFKGSISSLTSGVYGKVLKNFSIDANGNIITSECSDSEELSEFYIQTVSARWNTDATGTDSGRAKSTDSFGNHQTVLPVVKMNRSISALPYVVTNRWGKILKNAGLVYDQVSDRAGPVLIAVKAGQELHDEYDPVTGEGSQHSYDSHNYLEFVYSEAVDFENPDGTSLLAAFQAPDVPEEIENIRVNTNLGVITNKVSGFDVAGLASLAGGKVVTGIEGTENNTVHAFYRNSPFAVRLSIAGFTEGNETDNHGNLFKKWIGYIDSAEIPSGSVKLPSGGAVFVRDMAMELDGISEHKNPCKLTKPSLAVTKAVNDSEAPWDIKKPVFAIYHSASREGSWEVPTEKTLFESIGSTVDGTSSLKRLEFHVFDNEPEYSYVDVAEWVIRRGWVKNLSRAANKTELYKPDTYAADIFGGSHPFADSGRTGGGIRYSTISRAATAFRYGIGTMNKPVTKFNEAKFAYSEGTSPLFLPSNGSSHSSNYFDGLYFGFELDSYIMSLQTQFTVSYDSSKAWLTDLAGNRMESAVIKTLDLTPPSFNLTLAAQGQKKLYVMFSKCLSFDEKITLNDGVSEDSRDLLSELPKALGLYSISGGAAVPSTDIKIDEKVPAKLILRNDDYCGVELTLSKEVTLDNIKNLYLVVNSIGTYIDPTTGAMVDSVSFIQDELGNYMIANSAHAMSDFAINVINPIYAYNDTIIENKDPVQKDFYGEGSHAVHDWNRDQKNFGTLSGNDGIHIISMIGDEASVSGNSIGAKIYLDGTPDGSSVSVEYNKATGENWRVWVPEVVNAVSHNSNKPDVVSQGKPVDSSDFSKGMDFEVQKEQTEKWDAGTQVSFLFSLTDSTGNDIKIYRNPMFANGSFTMGNASNLFALCLENEKDITSLDLWSFRLRDIIKQRGGVSIMNNVINSVDGEKATVRIDNPKSGRVEVMVMTLDGNVIEYLNHGNLKSGTSYFTWKGKNKNGKPVARGMYFIRVIGNGFDETRKVMVVK